MAQRSQLPEEVARYVHETFTKETQVQQRLRAETAALPGAQMLSGPDQAAFLALLVRFIGARRVLEIGTFTGYSALAFASALPEGGQVITCDVNEESTAIARRYWAEAGLTSRVDLRLGPALTTLDALLKSDGAGSFDLAYIDADKESVDAYYEACLRLVRSGGVITIDNVLWSGAVADPKALDPSTMALKNLNAKIRDDARVEPCLVSMGDGVMVCRKREQAQRQP